MAIGKIDILDMRGAKVGVGIESIFTYYAVSSSSAAPPELAEVDLISNDEGILNFSDVDTTFKIDSLGRVWGFQKGIDLLLTIDQDLITGVHTGDWVSRIEDLPEGWDQSGTYLWVKTIQTLTNKEKVITYAVYKQGEKGDQGLPGADASGFYIETSQPEILMLKDEKYKTVFSPQSLLGKIYKKDLAAQDGQEQIKLTDSDSNYLTLWLYSSSTGFYQVAQKPTIEADGGFRIDIEKLLKEQTAETVLKISFIKEVDKKQVNLSSYLTVRFGINSDMASLNVNANGIVSAIQETKLEFSANGLTIKNGGIKIVNKNENSVLYANDNGDLTLKGYINAWGGYFSGKLEAATGSFSGELTAAKINSVTGEIGGFTIGDGSLASIGRTNNIPNIILNGKDGKIIANNIELGTGATIKDYIRIGNSVILRTPNELNSNFLEVGNIIAFDSSGKIKIGNNNNLINIDGAVGTITSTNYSDSNHTGWMISNQEAVFNNVTVRGEIKSAIFTAGEVQAVGGNILVRPSSFIENIIPHQLDSGELGYIISFKEKIDFKVGDWGRIGGENSQEYWFQTDQILENSIITWHYSPALVVQLLGQPVINFGQDKEVGISINGSTSSSFSPKQAISVFEFNAIDKKINPKVVMGKIPDEENYGQLRGTYGLYADNVLLRGSLITQGIDGISCGISTSLGVTEYIKALRVVSYHNVTDWPYITKVAVNSALNFKVGENCYIQLNDDEIITAEVVQIWEEDTGAVLDLGFNANDYGQINWVGLPISSVKRPNATTARYSKELGNLTGSILLWAGAKGEKVSDIEQANFIVDQHGNVVAKSGYFTGTIISNSKITASEIETAILTGSGYTPALVIRDCEKGIDFKKGNDSIFYLGANELIANIDSIKFNKNFIIDDIGAFSAPEAWIRNFGVERALRFSTNKISVLKYNEKEPENSIVNHALDLSNGFDFLIGGTRALAITEKGAQVTQNFQVDGEISYGQIGKYVAVKVTTENDTEKIVGYDLYINDGGEGE